VLVKLVRVLANLAIHADIGPLLAAQPRVLGLVSLLQRKNVDAAQELVLNIIGAINNISFYRGSGNQILLTLERVAAALAGFFLNPNMDVVIETARVFGNFSQDPRVCALLKRHRGLSGAALLFLFSLRFFFTRSGRDYGCVAGT
jgi:hypothetical protein